MDVTVQEVKKVLGDLGTTFHEFKQTFEEQLAQKADKGQPDPLTEEKFGRINDALGVMQSKMDKINTQLERPVLSGSDREDREAEEKKAAFDKVLRRGYPTLTEPERKALEPTPEVKAFIEGDRTSDHAIMVPIQIQAEWLQELKDRNSIRTYARNMAVSGPEIKWPVASGTFGRGWVEEMDARPETTTPNLTMKSFGLNEYYALPFASHYMLEDLRFDLEQFIREGVTEAFGEEEDEVFLHGNGVKKPKGLLHEDHLEANAAAALTHDKIRVLAATNTPTGDAHGAGFNAYDLLNLIANLAPAYRRNAAFYAEETVQTHLRTMKIGDTLIWSPTLQVGVPQSIYTYPLRTLVNMSIAAEDGDIALLFGDMGRTYVVFDYVGTSMYKRDDITDLRGVKFYFRRRLGGGLLDGRPMRAMTRGATPTPAT